MSTGLGAAGWHSFVMPILIKKFGYVPSLIIRRIARNRLAKYKTFNELRNPDNPHDKEKTEPDFVGPKNQRENIQEEYERQVNPVTTDAVTMEKVVVNDDNNIAAPTEHGVVYKCEHVHTGEVKHTHVGEVQYVNNGIEHRGEVEHAGSMDLKGDVKHGHSGRVEHAQQTYVATPPVPTPIDPASIKTKDKPLENYAAPSVEVPSGLDRGRENFKTPDQQPNDASKERALRIWKELTDRYAGSDIKFANVLEDFNYLYNQK